MESQIVRNLLSNLCISVIYYKISYTFCEMLGRLIEKKSNTDKNKVNFTVQL